jgi:hypothetical protein
MKKRRRPTPEFKIPYPVHPIGAQYADLAAQGLFPYCAMMQVAKEDVHRDYVICRGFDIRMRKFIDYDATDEVNKPGIPVAKPYGKRVKGAYQIGQVFGAFLPTQGPTDYVPPSPSDVDWRVGQNPGVAETTPGHPADLDEAINELMTDDGEKYVNWMLIDTADDFIWCMLMEDHPGRYTCFEVLQGVWCPKSAKFLFDCDASEDDYLIAVDLHYTMSAGGLIPEPKKYAQGWFKLEPLDNNTDHTMIAVVVTLDCDSDDSCTNHQLTDGECPDTETDPCA